MSRPDTFDDIDDYSKSPHDFLNLDVTYLTRDVTVGAAALTLIDAVRNSTAFDLSEDGEFKATVPLTDAELDSRLRSAQRSWDRDREDYMAAIERTKDIASWRRAGIDRWATKEGLDPIDWDALEVKA